MKTPKRTPINEKTPINSLKIDKEHSTIIINDEIRLVFLNLYHFNLVLKAQERMLDSKIKRATGKDMNVAVRQVEKDLSTNVKRIKTFKSFCNFWKSGCANKHINTNYFRVERLDNSLVGDPSDEKKEGLKEDRRRLFLKKIFLHNNKAKLETSQFWLAISEQQEKSWRIQYKEKLLKELNNDESLKDGQFIRLRINKNVMDDSGSNELRQSSFVNKDIISLLNSLGDNLKLVIVGEAGAGKSTTLKYFLKQRLSNFDFSNNSSKIPVFISLIRLKENETLESLITDSIRQHTKKLPSDIDIYRNFLLIFDGLDEITNNALHSDALAELDNILSNSDSSVILSCRSNDYHNDFVQFPCYKLQELSEELITSYLTSFFDKDAVNLLEKKIKPDNNLLSMSRIPFLLNIITKHIKISPNKALPANKGLLIREFLNKIISQKPRKDIKAKPISSHDKFRFLGILAYSMICADEKNGEYSCSLQTRDKVEDIWNSTMSQVKSGDILLRAEKERILKSGSTYENPVFAHALIRDYFAAYYIASVSTKELIEHLKSLLEFKKWDNTISFLVGIVNADDANKIIHLLIESDCLLAERCIRMAKGITTETEKKLTSKIASLDVIGSFIYSDVIVKIGETACSIICGYNWGRVMYDLGFLKFDDIFNYLTKVIILIKDIIDNSILIEDSIDILNYRIVTGPMITDKDNVRECKICYGIELHLLNKNHPKDRNIVTYIDFCKVILQPDKKDFDSCSKLKGTETIDQLINILKESKNIDVIIKAIRALGQTKSEKVITPLIELITKNNDYLIQLNAIRALCSMLSKKAINPLIELTNKSQTDHIPIFTVISLGKTKSKKALPFLKEIFGRKKHIDQLIHSAIQKIRIHSDRRFLKELQQFK